MKTSWCVIEDAEIQVLSAGRVWVFVSVWFQTSDLITMGVITVTDIDYGHIFGPFPSHVTPADPAYLIGMLTNDKRPDGLMLKVRGHKFSVNTLKFCTEQVSK